jgi:hypothetical protein
MRGVMVAQILPTIYKSMDMVHGRFFGLLHLSKQAPVYRKEGHYLNVCNISSSEVPTMWQARVCISTPPQSALEVPSTESRGET